MTQVGRTKRIGDGWCLAVVAMYLVAAHFLGGASLSISMKMSSRCYCV